jgi:hypothetical protein
MDHRTPFRLPGTLFGSSEGDEGLGGGQMRKLLLAGALLAAVGCKRADTDADAGGADHTRSGTDTVVTTTPVRDTTIVKADTTVSVDTLRKTDNVPDKAKRDGDKR